MRIKRSLTSFILASFDKAENGYIRLEDFLNNSEDYIKGYERPITKANLSQSLKRLREKGWIVFLDQEKLLMKLTNKGREQALQSSFHDSSAEWDGKWRLVIFDIPEKRRPARDLLRSKLKQWNFTPWQRSVWASRKDCTKSLREFIKHAGIEEWVMVIESDNVGKSFS